jgi:hypothetical protein
MASHANLPVIAVATDLAIGFRVLAPMCSIAIVAAVGTDWQLLVRRGEIDVTSHWHRALADRVLITDRPEHESGCLVAPFSCVELHALLVIGPDEHLPARILERSRPLLDGGGILLDRALRAQRHDRVLRRVVGERRRASGLSPRSLPALARAVTGLWPGAEAGFHAASAVEEMRWTTGWAMRVAIERGAPAVARTPIDEGLMPPDLRWEIAVPAPALGGAMLIETHAAGETADTASIAVAAEIVSIARSESACIVSGCAASSSSSSSPPPSSPPLPLLRRRRASP